MVLLIVVKLRGRASRHKAARFKSALVHISYRSHTYINGAPSAVPVE